MNWKELARCLFVIAKGCLKIVLTFIELAAAIDKSGSKKGQARHSALCARDLYESGDISYTEYQRALDPD